ncbi:mediator of RNA polymerase II transcription subunit 17-like [Anneissia japonica]|uniref:mediator of RNA polymerase II transcription subunit 17-like n=1 Tax=Anneissia japonica TaxID=1529436 RepID=UPI0014258BB7|nr:mediator of RNA polymerase II transcription subunit 17-like [Anneissia japonica]
MAAHSVQVSVESLLENQVQEVSLDGQETYNKPLSMSENLAKLAQKIDFSKEVDLRGIKEEEEEDEDKADGTTSFQHPQWPWESVRNKLRTAFTEISVLSDIIHIAKEKKYLVLDPVSQEAPVHRPVLKLVAKKKALTGAAEILLKGAKVLSKPTTETNCPDFHAELLKLCQHWRLKKVGNSILGDLSFKSAGSRFWHNGVFEVIKTPDSDQTTGAINGVNKSPLQVMLPTDLEGTSYIQVIIQIGDADIASTVVSQMSRSKVSADAHWQERLEAAQNVLFCKELFSQIAREAVQLKSPVPHLVIGNQIICSLFPRVQLRITLCHDSNADDGIPPMQTSDQNTSLEHSLHQMLKALHISNQYTATPHPVTMSHVVSKKRRLAGPNASTKRDVTDKQHGECILERIIKQAKHIVLRKRVAKVIDEFAREHSDPTLITHWGSSTQPLLSTVIINIVSQGYDQMQKTIFQLFIECDHVQAVLRDGRVAHLSYEEQDLYDLLLSQVSSHQIITLSVLAKFIRMQILQQNIQVGVGEMAKLGNASSLMLLTPNGKNTISVRSDPLNGIKVFVQGTKPPYSSPEPKSNIVTDPKYDNFTTSFREVDWKRLPGRNFIHSMELMMAALM